MDITLEFKVQDHFSILLFINSDFAVYFNLIFP